jgi:hypothetical protein
MGKYVTVDTGEALRMFKELESKNQKKAHSTALRRGANILLRETKKNIRLWVKTDGSHSLWRKRGAQRKKKNGEVMKPMEYGVKTRVDKEATEAKVHIMGDYMLKWFELGTKPRFRSRKKLYMFKRHDYGKRWYWRRDGGKDIPTGQIQPAYFFRKARDAKEKEIEGSMERILAESIMKVHKRYS